MPRSSNEPIFSQLDATGMLRGERRPVRYLFLGPKRRLAALGRALAQDGLKIGSFGEFLSAEEMLPLEPATIDERTLLMELVADQHGVKFDGWEIAVLAVAGTDLV